MKKENIVIILVIIAIIFIMIVILPTLKGAVDDSQMDNHISVTFNDKELTLADKAVCVINDEHPLVFKTDCYAIAVTIADKKPYVCIGRALIMQFPIRLLSTGEPIKVKVEAFNRNKEVISTKEYWIKGKIVEENDCMQLVITRNNSQNNDYFINEQTKPLIF